MRLFLFSLGILGLPAAAFADEQGGFGRVVTLSGRVFAVAGESTRQLEPGVRLSRGDIVRTEDHSHVQLLLADKTVMSIGPRAEVALEKLEPGARPTLGVKLVVGRLWARIQRALGGDTAFSVTTSNAVAGVRGTSFVVETKGEDTTVTVERGVVNVQNGGGTGDDAGENMQATVHGGEPPVFTPVSQETVATQLQDFSIVRGLDQEGASERIGALQDGLAAAAASVVTPPAAATTTGVPTPPLDLDPQQTLREATIRGRIEIVP